jgi:hypothetical protein
MDASDVQSGSGGDKRKSTHWVLALQLYHAIKIDEASSTGANPSSSSASASSSSASSDGPSILDELREIGEDNHVEKGGPMCGTAPPETPGSSWVIPARGTPEYADVMYIMRCLKENARFEDDARELIRLRASNRELLRLNNVDL